MTPPVFRLVRQEEHELSRMEEWRRNVGAHVALDATPPTTPSAAPCSLVVLSWNVWIGRGRLREVIRRIREGEYARLGASPDLPLVVLAQEVYRGDSSVPEIQEGRTGRVLLAPMGQQEDIVDAARELGMSLRYAPSMRNGLTRTDRGNAILSTVPLHDAEAIELPLVLQRRVSVAATISLGTSSLRVISAHFDPRGRPGHNWLGSAGRAQQAQHLISRIDDDTAVLGADLNLGRGRQERTWRLLGEAGFTFGIPPTAPAWRHTFHALPRLVLDYVLVRDRGGIVAGARVHRVDEDPHDRGPRVFGSDHHPLLARIDLKPGPEDAG